MSKNVKLELTVAQANVLFDAAVQMQDDAQEVFGFSTATALDRALRILVTALEAAE